MNQTALDYNQITDFLYVGKTPKLTDFEELSDKDVELIINMRAEKYAFPTKIRKSIKTIWAPSLDTPFTPIRVKRIIKAVRHASETIAEGGSVYVYCRAGRHRSVAMAVAILISQGYDIYSAVSLIKSKRVVADPEMPHIYKVITKFSQLWNAI